LPDLSPNAEGEIALRAVGINRQDAPDHLVSSGTQRLERHPQLCAISAEGGFAGSHCRTLFIAYVDAAEGRLKLVREPEHDLFWRLRDRAADGGACVVEMSMRESRRCRREDKSDGCENDAHD
jgi:hypothetical protein